MTPRHLLTAADLSRDDATAISTTPTGLRRRWSVATSRSRRCGPDRRHDSDEDSNRTCARSRKGSG